MADIERLLKHKIPEQVIAGYEPNPAIPAEPISHGRQYAHSRQSQSYPPRSHSGKANQPPRTGNRQPNRPQRKVVK